MRSRVPIIYLVDSAGVNLPYQGGVFPGQYGASRIFYYNSIMRRYLKVPQISAVMGPCIAGGAYLPRFLTSSSWLRARRLWVSAAPTLSKVRPAKLSIMRLSVELALTTNCPALPTIASQMIKLHREDSRVCFRTAKACIRFLNSI